MNSLFKLRGELSRSQSIIWGIIGLVVLLLFWWSLAEYKSDLVPDVTLSQYPSSINADAETLAIIDSLATVDSLAIVNATEFKKVYPIIPRPIDVVHAVPIMINEEKLLSNTGLSIWRNVQGYLWAIMVCVPIGFLIGLFPVFKGMFNGPIDALRFLPLTALTGLFMLAFQDQTENMKVSFLAFGIIVYLLPIVVQRIREVADIYLKTTFTLGATDWQTIKTVYFPSVMSKLMDDVRVITAISWTYIIIAELLGKEGGIGALMHTNGRQGQTEKVFVGLAVIILVGYLQDRIFVYMDKRLFPHKYYPTTIVGMKESQYGIYTILAVVILLVILAMLIPTIYTGVFPLVVGVFIVSSLIIIGFGEFKIFKSLRNA